MPHDLDTALSLAAAAIAKSDALLIGAGAGMGVDSGLPDFRGDEGFWKAYPPFRGKRFAEMSNPYWFDTDPGQAWGFFGHRLNLYRRAEPHAGFAILRRWGERMPGGLFVFTSNVDGQFQKAGFPDDRILECHGSIHHMQCSSCVAAGIWHSGDMIIDVDETTIRSAGPWPKCDQCKAVARPNILMFGDDRWLSDRAEEQSARFERWLNEVRDQRVVAIEMGAGLAIPTVRRVCEQIGRPLIRINPREAEVPTGDISIPLGAREALERIAGLCGTP